MAKLLKSNGKKGKILFLPYTDTSFIKLGLEKDVDIIDEKKTIAWTHRKSLEGDIYFISNQKDARQNVTLSFRIAGKEPELWDAVSGKIKNADEWRIKNGRTYLNLTLEPDQSLFIVFRKATSEKENAWRQKNPAAINQTLIGPWQVQFDKNNGGPAQPVVFKELKTWSQQEDSLIKYYSGTAVYSKVIEWNSAYENKEVWLKIDSIFNMATIKLNGVDCGTLWTRPYQAQITKALKKGINTLEIEVSNTWANRLIGDNRVPADKRITWTTAPFRLSGKPLLPAGLVGEAILIIRDKN
jgi:hypothetical protein